jgi:bifunctional non-homologous end joining protein LigD
VKPRSAAHRLPEFVEPMKAKLVGSMPVGAWIYEIKFDGYRALALRAGGETRILSRNEKDLGSKFPAVRDSIAALDVQDAIIDYAECGIIDAMPLRRNR